MPMQLIRCTQKLFKELRRSPTGDEPLFSFLGSWHANVIRINRKKCVLFTNDKTLFSIFSAGLKRPQFDRLDEVFRLECQKRLVTEGFSASQVEKALSEYQQIDFAKTNSRSVLGVMNDIVYQIQVRIEMNGGLANTKLDAVNHEINRIPSGVLKYGYSIDHLSEMLNQYL